jgi:predicted nucleic acid-binding protein
LIVVDSSAALAWSFVDERNAATLAIASRVRDEGAVVPSLWKLEVANILRLAVRKERITALERNDTLRDFERLGIEIDGETADRAWNETLAVADRHDLTVYDAAYLELAKRRGLPLATLDQALANAARQEGVEVLP